MNLTLKITLVVVVQITKIINTKAEDLTQRNSEENLETKRKTIHTRVVNPLSAVVGRSIENSYSRLKSSCKHINMFSVENKSFSHFVLAISECTRTLILVVGSK